MACHMGTWWWSYVYLHLCITPYCHHALCDSADSCRGEYCEAVVWMRCRRTCHSVFPDFSAGTLDGNNPFQTSSALSMYRQLWGKTKSKQVQVSSQCPVSDAVSALGQYMEFSLLETQETPSGATSSTMRSSFTLLMASANATSFPPNWDSVPNKRVLLKNPHHPLP